VQYLSMKVTLLNDITIDYTNGAYTRASQVCCGWTAETTGTDDEY